MKYVECNCVDLTNNVHDSNETERHKILLRSSKKYPDLLFLWSPIICKALFYILCKSVSCLGVASPKKNTITFRLIPNVSFIKSSQVRRRKVPFVSQSNGCTFGERICELQKRKSLLLIYFNWEQNLFTLTKNYKGFKLHQQIYELHNT